MTRNIPNVSQIMRQRGDALFQSGMANYAINHAIRQEDLELLQAIVGTRMFLDHRVLERVIYDNTRNDILRFVIERSPPVDNQLIEYATNIGRLDVLQSVIPNVTELLAAALEERLSEEESIAIQRAAGARRYNEHLRAGTLDDQDREWLAGEQARLSENQYIDVPRPSVVNTNTQFLEHLRTNYAQRRPLPEGTEDSTLADIEPNDEYVLCENMHPTLVSTLEGYCAQTNTPCNVCPLCRAPIRPTKYVNTR